MRIINKIYMTTLKRFDPKKVNHPPVTSAVSMLTFIGAYIESRFIRLAKIYTLRGILKHMKAHTKAENTDWLSEIVKNKQRGTCVPGNGSGYHLYGRPYNYNVRQVNWFAYNAIVTYIAQELAGTIDIARVPDLLEPETILTAYPSKCGFDEG